MRKDIGYSAVLTENSLFQFLKQTFSSAENRLPPQLLSKLQRKKFLFLGFNFNDWYFRPLIDLLNLRKRNLNVIASKSSQTIAVSNHIVYSDFYKFHFTNFEVEDFINKLVEEFPQDVKKATLVYHENDEDTLNEFCSYWGKKAQYIKFVRIRDNEYPTIQIENQQPIIFWCTQDLLNTSFSENKDALPAIVEQCKQECICLIPIVVKSCMYQDIFDEIFSLCKANQKPIYSYQDQATVYTGIAIELNEIIFPKNK